MTVVTVTQTDTVVAIYARLSFDRHDDGLGVERQLDECRDYADQRGWTVSTLFTDNDVSATTGVRRPGFEALLAARPPAVLVWHTDRLIRVSRDLERVLDLGCAVYGVTAGHLDLATPAGRAVARTITAWSQYEGEQKAERMRAAYRQKAAAGKAVWIKRPFGYNRDTTHHPEEAPLLAQAYEDIVRGSNYSRVSRQWNEAGVTTTEGKAWAPNTVRQTMRAPRNCGLREYQREVVGRGDWEPIVSEDLWRAVTQRVRETRRRGLGKITALLSGIAVCARCEGTLRIGRDHPSGDRGYTCVHGHHLLPMTWLDEQVWGEALATYLPRNPAALTPPVDNTGRLLDINVKLDAIRDKLTKLGKAFAADLVDEDTLTAATEDLQAQRTKLTAELEEVQTPITPIITVIEDASGKPMGYRHANGTPLTLTERRELLVKLFDRIVVSPRGPGSRTFDKSIIELTPRPVAA